MTIENRHLQKDSIESPELYRAIIKIAPRRIDAAVFSQRIDGSLTLTGDNTSGTLKQYEDFIYENPLLLTPLRKTDVIIQTSRYLLIPSGIPSDLYTTLIGEAFPESDEKTVPVVNALYGTEMSILFAVEENLFRFVNRAFSNPGIYSHLYTLLRFFSDRNRFGNGTRLFANLRPDSLDIAAVINGEIRFANTFSFKATEDAVYYILAVRQTLGLTSDADSIMLCGDSAIKRKLIPELREFIPNVIPAIFPADLFRTGKEAIYADFDYIILPLCE